MMSARRSRSSNSLLTKVFRSRFILPRLPRTTLTLFLTTATDAHYNALPDNPDLRTPEPDITEAGIYKKLGLSYIPPELRQDGTSVTAA